MIYLYRHVYRKWFLIFRHEFVTGSVANVNNSICRTPYFRVPVSHSFNETEGYFLFRPNSVANAEQARRLIGEPHNRSTKFFITLQHPRDVLYSNYCGYVSWCVERIFKFQSLHSVATFCVDRCVVNQQSYCLKRAALERSS